MLVWVIHNFICVNIIELHNTNDTSNILQAGSPVLLNEGHVPLCCKSSQYGRIVSHFHDCLLYNFWHECSKALAKWTHKSQCHYSASALQGPSKQTALSHVPTFACYYHLCFIRVIANVSLSPVFTGMAETPLLSPFTTIKFTLAWVHV